MFDENFDLTHLNPDNTEQSQSREYFNYADMMKFYARKPEPTHKDALGIEQNDNFVDQQRQKIANDAVINYSIVDEKIVENNLLHDTPDTKSLVQHQLDQKRVSFKDDVSVNSFKKSSNRQPHRSNFAQIKKKINDKKIEDKTLGSIVNHAYKVNHKNQPRSSLWLPNANPEQDVTELSISNSKKRDVSFKRLPDVVIEKPPERLRQKSFVVISKAPPNKFAAGLQKANKVFDMNSKDANIQYNDSNQESKFATYSNKEISLETVVGKLDISANKIKLQKTNETKIQISKRPTLVKPIKNDDHLSLVSKPFKKFSNVKIALSQERVSKHTREPVGMPEKKTWHKASNMKANRPIADGDAKAEDVGVTENFKVPYREQYANKEEETLQVSKKNDNLMELFKMQGKISGSAMPAKNKYTTTLMSAGPQRDNRLPAPAHPNIGVKHAQNSQKDFTEKKRVDKGYDMSHLAMKKSNLSVFNNIKQHQNIPDENCDSLESATIKSSQRPAKQTTGILLTMEDDAKDSRTLKNTPKSSVKQKNFSLERQYELCSDLLTDTDTPINT